MASNIFSRLVKILKKKKEAGMLLIGLGIAVLFQSVSGIGCPIRWLTGISCAGCGMTRALSYAVRFRFDKAFYYHPLFWMLPLGAVLYFLWDRIPPKLQKGILWTVVVCFAAVYFIRLGFSDHSVVNADVQAGFVVRFLKHLIS